MTKGADVDDFRERKEEKNTLKAIGILVHSFKMERHAMTNVTPPTVLRM